MNLQVFHPRDPMRQLRNEMNQLFSNFRSVMPRLPWYGPEEGLPALNVWYLDDTLFAEMELPGSTINDIDLSVDGGELTIKVERPVPELTDERYHRHERSRGTFVRKLRLPFDVETSKVEARLNDGILCIELPKAEACKPKKIEVVAS